MKDEVILEYIASYLDQGYAINEVLDLLECMDKNTKIRKIKKFLMNGESLDQAILMCDFDAMFKEYFSFYLSNHTISKAIIQSLNICKVKRNVLHKLKKELSYPIFLLLFLLFFSLFLTYGLFPQIKSLFQEFSLQRSLFQNILFFIFETTPLLILISSLCFIIVFIGSIYSVKKQRFHHIDFIMERIPIINQYIKYYYSLKFAIYYNELMKNGYESSRIIDMLNKQIGDSDIKMIVYEIYQEVLQGKDLELIVENFSYFDHFFKEYFKLLLLDTTHDKSLSTYIESTIQLIHHNITKFIKCFIPITYGFVTMFVVSVYISIILPMMDIINVL